MPQAHPNRVCSSFGIRRPLLMGAVTPLPQLGAVEGISSPDDVPSVAEVIRELGSR